MESAFVYVSSGTEKTHLTDEVEVTPELDADEDELLDGALLQDVRGVRLVVQLETLLPPGGDRRLALAGVFLDLLRATEIDFVPDTSRPTARFRVVADLRHRMTLRAAREGTLRHRHRLRFKSLQRYAPDDALLTDLITVPIADIG